MPGVHALGGAFIPYDTEVNVNTTNTAYQVALNLTAGFGMALVHAQGNVFNLTSPDLKTTVNGNVVANGWNVALGYSGMPYVYVWTSSFKVEYKAPAGNQVNCRISYKNYV